MDSPTPTAAVEHPHRGLVDGLPALAGPRYVAEPGDGGWDIIDTRTGESVGVAASHEDADATAQRLGALITANEVRVKRATLKRDIKAGRVTIQEILLDPPAYVHSATVYDVLMAAPAYGRVKATKILQLRRIPPTKRIGDLTPRQRTELVVTLRPAATLVPVASGGRGHANVSPDAQHMRALLAANDTRLRRSELKRRVATGETTVADVLREMPEAARTMTITELVMSQHRWGRTRTRRLLAAIPLLERKLVGTMTERQRDLVAQRLAEGLPE